MTRSYLVIVAGLVPAVGGVVLYRKGKPAGRTASPAASDVPVPAAEECGVEPSDSHGVHTPVRNGAGAYVPVTFGVTPAVLFRLLNNTSA